ncbi:his Kinase A (phospho-acceptor) domain protein [bacterium BMS3Abin07]|nr:his Kinase A (phospho-acceptor) domain protein [bacterium BMS3Abin07]GBE33393.1 his Kinase A (phospho-acceptor) domain protein [bacterium BMS3Bbin05]
MRILYKRVRHFLWHNISGESQTLKLTVIYSIPFLVIFSVLLGVLIFREVGQHKKEQVDELLYTAGAFYNQIMVEKEWIENHNVLYYNTKNNDGVATTSGSNNFIKLNFAEMIKGAGNVADDKAGYKFHITSLDITDQDHKPDTWDVELVRKFGKGIKEKYVINEEKGERYFRYLRLIPSENNQLGNKYAFAVSIPMKLSDSIHSAKTIRNLISFGVIGGVSIFFMIFVIWRFSKKISLAIDKEMYENRLKAAMELAGAAAHEMRQPLQVILGSAALMMKERTSCGEGASECLDIIQQQCRMTDDIIKKMLNITHYTTKEYIKGIHIFDLHARDEKSRMN